MFALLVAGVALGALPAAPLEPQAVESLRAAQRTLSAGKRGRGLATLDSLVFRDGVTVALEKPSKDEPSVAKALETWNDDLGERTFRMRRPGETADVVVRFVPSLDALGDDVQGMVSATRQIAWSERDHSYRLQATIFVRDNIDDRPLRPEEVVNVVAHEAGHLLGLADVDRRDRLMGPIVVGRTHDGPAPEEVATVVEYRASVRRSYPKG